MTENSKDNTLNRLSNRIDFQVMLLVTIFTFFSTAITAYVYGEFTYNVLIKSLEERTYAIYNAVENVLNKQTFDEINVADDMDTQLYKEAKETLLVLKNACGVLYLYTAKEDKNGHFVYVIDGLEDYLDFRYPGDLIEDEITPKLNIAMENIHVIPENILNTDWGDIFVSYLPIHNNNGEVIGVLGVEFDATDAYYAYSILQKFTPVTILIFVIFSAIVSLTLFKRVSNPLYLDKSTIDSTTGLKNRNAYNVDFNNFLVRKNINFLGIIVADINGLKEVNDRLGHISGDDYIILVADAIKETKLKQMIAYRTGGDEFVVMMQNAREEEFDMFIRNCSKLVKEQDKYDNMRCSLSCGYAIFDPKKDNDIEDTYHRADSLMYEEKRRQKEGRER